MACKKKKDQFVTNVVIDDDRDVVDTVEIEEQEKQERLLFGVDSRVKANELLQNNITEFEWVARNKGCPNFWGRNLVGNNPLTKEEIDFLHDKGCKIGAIYTEVGEKNTEEEGQQIAKRMNAIALELGIPRGKAIFLEILEKDVVSYEFMLGFASELLSEGFVPAFKANTDAAFDFDREYSRGIQVDKEVFGKCLIWAVAPSLEEYEGVTTTHLFHPDNWLPFAPSGIARQDIAVWQYGKKCHPIDDNNGNKASFNVNLVKEENIILDKMF